MSDYLEIVLTMVSRQRSCKVNISTSLIPKVSIVSSQATIIGNKPSADFLTLPRCIEEPSCVPSS